MRKFQARFYGRNIGETGPFFYHFEIIKADDLVCAKSSINETFEHIRELEIVEVLNIGD